MNILVLNSGSSSQKACFYQIGDALPDHPPTALWEGKVEWRPDSAYVETKNSAGAVQRNNFQGCSRKQVVECLLGTLWYGDTSVIASAQEIDVVGHRVVHGGATCEEPVVINADIKALIASMSSFAPLHIQAEVEGMDTAGGLLDGTPQVAVFDTGFHRQMPLSAAVYPVPYEWFESGIRRYGFHGINHQYCAGRVAQLLHRELNNLRIVSCHLGNGCSLAAIRDGRSVDTTMGFTPLDGLMMGSRSGAIDPGVLIHMMRKRHFDAEKLDGILNQRSGLLGVSGLSSDMRDILAAIGEGNERAKLAFDIYVHRVRAAIGSMAAVLGRVDALVFTAGIGENSPDVRSAACRTLEFLGVKLDEDKNAHPSGDEDIATADSKVRVLVIRAQEDWAIAVECWKLIGAGRELKRQRALSIPARTSIGTTS